MQKWIFTGIFLLLLLALATSSFSASYYVSPEGDDAQPGTLDQPWKTIQQAVDRLQPGDILYLRAGTYPEEVIMTTSGATGQPIVISNYENEEATIDATNKSFGISIRNAHYITLRGLRIFGATKHWSKDQGNIHLFQNPSHITIEKCELFEGTRGIRYSNEEYKPAPFYISIIDCDIHDNLQEGIYLNSVQEGAHHTIVRNKIYNNGHDYYLTEYGDKVRYNGLYFRSDSSLIEHNDVYNNGRNGMYLDVTSVRLCRYNIVRHNKIYHNGKNGMMFCHHYTLVHDNLIYDNGWDFTNAAMHGIYMAKASYNMFFNNEIYDHAYGGGIRLEGSYNVVWDNHFYHNGNGMYSTDRYGDMSYGNIIRNNRMYGNQQQLDGAIPGSGIEADGTQELRLYHNVFYDLRGFGLAFVDGHNYVSAGIKVKNNIVMNADWQLIWVKEESQEGYDEDYNVFFPDRADAVKFTGQSYSLDGYQQTTGQGKHSLFIDPLFVNAMGSDFHLQESSPCLDAGGFLTQTTQAGNGTQIPVADAMYFSDGHGIWEGDLIQLEGSDETVRVQKIDYNNNLLTVDHAISWHQNQGVSRPYQGTAPDIGVYETDATAPINLSATLTLSEASPLKADTITVTLTTNVALVKIPAPLFFTDDAGAQSQVELAGAVPGKTFTGNWIIDASIAEGTGEFELGADALEDASGNRAHTIQPAVKVVIDQSAPVKPEKVSVKP